MSNPIVESESLGKPIKLDPPRVCHVVTVLEHDPLSQKVLFEAEWHSGSRNFETSLDNVARTVGCTEDKIFCVGSEVEARNIFGLPSRTRCGKVVGIFSDNAIAFQEYNYNDDTIYRVHQDKVFVTRSLLSRCSIM